MLTLAGSLRHKVTRKILQMQERVEIFCDRQDFKHPRREIVLFL